VNHRSSSPVSVTAAAPASSAAFDDLAALGFLLPASARQ